MALGDPYASPQEYRATKDKPTTADDLDLDRQLRAVSRYIDRALGRTLGFNREDEDSQHIYLPRATKGPYRDDWAESENPWKYGNLTRVLDIDDLVSLTSVELDESRTGVFSQTLDAADFELLPRGAASRPEPEPYSRIELTTWGSQWGWPRGTQVRVTGKFGWPAIPSAIVDATIELTAILRIETPRATSQVNELNQVLSTSRAAQGIIESLLSVYRHAAVYL